MKKKVKLLVLMLAMCLLIFQPICLANEEDVEIGQQNDLIGDIQETELNIEVNENVQEESIVATSSENEYEYEVSSKGVTITGYKGIGGNVTIPDTIEGKPVIAIGEYSFCNCQILRKIIIPEGVTSIGEEAFGGCINLVSAVIPSTVTTIENYTFFECFSLTDITISSGVKKIGVCAFSSCSNLESILLPNTITTIDAYAFEGCYNLTNITIPNSVANIGFNQYDEGFYEGSIVNGCYNLTSINVDSNNEYYSSEDGVLFNKYKTQLLRYPEGKKDTSYQVLDSVDIIQIGAFDWCDNIENIIIPKNVTTINAIYGCSGLKNIDVDNNNEYYCSKDGVLFDKDMTELILYPINKQGTSYKIPDTVITIDVNAFEYCCNLTSLTIPRSVTYIDDCTFDRFGNYLTIYGYRNSEAERCADLYEWIQFEVLDVDITPYMFDTDLYYNLYGDLRQAYGYDAGALYQHYLTYGIKEGRIASYVFDPNYYLDNNRDVRMAFGDKNYELAYYHFIKDGINEGRQGSAIFNANYYLKIYDDLSEAYGETSYSKGLAHFINYGINEGRRSSSFFDVGLYKMNYGDLSEAYGNVWARYFQHYILYGQKEGRVCVRIF